MPNYLSDLEVFKEAGMNIREFTSNCVTEIQKLPKEDRIDKEEVKLLGISWNVKTDELRINLPTYKADKLTRRKVLAQIAKPFDPNGLISPIILPAKLFRQEIESDKKRKWDAELTSREKEKWTKIMNNWEEAQLIVPRKLFQEPSENAKNAKYELHGFADASSKAMGAAIYLRKIEGKNITTNLIFAKSLVVPANMPATKRTIPMLELHALMLLTKFVKYTMQELEDAVKIEKVQLWTDSADSLDYINSEKKLERFVKNRVDKIREWNVKHIEGKLNPADIASRGATPQELIETEQWWKGPAFLSEQDHKWKNTIKEFDTQGWAKKELEDTPVFEMSTATKEKSPKTQLEKGAENEIFIIDVNRFSNWKRLRNTIAYVMRITTGEKIGFRSEDANTKYKGLPKRKENNQKINTIRPLTGEEIKKAEELIIKKMQESDPPDEDMKRKLRIFKDEKGLFRSRGRIEKGGMDYDTVNPLYLSRRAPIIRLLIRNAHLETEHGQKEQILGYLRKKFWIPRCRRLISYVVRKNPQTKCGICAKLEAKAYSYPDAPTLPIHRVKGDSAFETIGVDNFGPMNVKIGDQTKKVWGTIFVCTLTRAIHIELVTECSGEKFLLALERFMRRRRVPKKIISDNGTNFVLGEKVIRKMAEEELRKRRMWTKTYEEKEIKEYTADKGIKWEFASPLAPWRSGFYERLIGIVKHHLYRGLGRKLMELEELTTYMVQVERIVNERPVTYISEDEVVEPLRPIQILNASEGTPFEFGGETEEEDINDPDYKIRKTNRDTLLETYKKAMYKSQMFWRGFRENYLLALREKEKGKKKTGNKNPKIGQVVIVKDTQHCPKNTWKLGRIEEIISDRTVKLRIGRKLFERANCLLYPLEIEDEADKKEEEREEKEVENISTNTIFHFLVNTTMDSYVTLDTEEMEEDIGSESDEEISVTARAPILLIGDEENDIEGLKQLLRENEARFMTVVPNKWDSSLFEQQIIMTEHVKNVIIYRRMLNMQLLAALISGQHNTSEDVKLFWIIHDDNFQSFGRPDQWPQVTRWTRVRGTENPEELLADLLGYGLHISTRAYTGKRNTEEFKQRRQKRNRGEGTSNHYRQDQSLKIGTVDNDNSDLLLKGGKLLATENPLQGGTQRTEGVQRPIHTKSSFMADARKQETVFVDSRKRERSVEGRGRVFINSNWGTRQTYTEERNNNFSSCHGESSSGQREAIKRAAEVMSRLGIREQQERPLLARPHRPSPPWPVNIEGGHFFFGAPFAFSNFHNTDLTLNIEGHQVKVWCVEQGYCIRKALHFNRPNLAMEIATNPQLRAKDMKHMCDRRMEEFMKLEEAPMPFHQHEWNRVRENIMMKILREKFDQHPRIKDMLMKCEGYIGEASPNRSWGIGHHIDNREDIARAMRNNYFPGTNLLGKLLMALRAEYKQEGKTPFIVQKIRAQPTLGNNNQPTHGDKGHNRATEQDIQATHGTNEQLGKDTTDSATHGPQSVKENDFETQPESKKRKLEGNESTEESYRNKEIETQDDASQSDRKSTSASSETVGKCSNNVMEMEEDEDGILFTKPKGIEEEDEVEIDWEANKFELELNLDVAEEMKMEKWLTDHWIEIRETEKDKRMKEEEFDRVKRVLERYHRGEKMTAEKTGSSVCGLATTKSDLDITIIPQEEDTRFDQGKKTKISFLQDFRRSWRRSGADFVVADIWKGRIPVINAEVSTREGIICVQICVANPVASLNSQLSKKFVDKSINVQLLYGAIKQWADLNDIRDSKKNTLSSYSWRLLIIFYLQIREILPSMEKIDEITDFRTVNSEFVLSLLIGFFKFYATFDFYRDRISIRKGKVTKREREKEEWKGERYIFIEEPYSRQNVAKNVDALGFHLIQRKIREIWNMVNAPTVKAIQMLEMLGIELKAEWCDIGWNEVKTKDESRKTTATIDETMKGLSLEKGKPTLTEEKKKHIESPEEIEEILRQDGDPGPQPELNQEEIEELLKEPVEKQQEGTSTTEGGKPNSQEKKGEQNEIGKISDSPRDKSGNGVVNTINTIMIICLITLGMGIGTHAAETMAMLCHRRTGSNFVEIKKDNNPCTQLGNLFEEEPREQTLDIFRPDQELFTIWGFRCMKVRQKQKYWTNLLNDPLKDDPEIENLPVTTEECVTMLNERKCEYGILTGEEETQLHSNNQLKLEFSCWKFHKDEAIAENCFIAKIAMLSRPGSEELHSPVEDLTKCELSKGTCRMKGGGRLIWTIARTVGQEYDERTCTYKQWKTQEGKAKKGIWIANSNDFAITFSEHAKTARSCGVELVISDQGYAIRDWQYREIMSKKRKRRSRNSDSKERDPIDQNQKTSTAAAQLTARSIYQNNETKTLFQNMIRLICETVENSALTKDLSHLDATSLMREKSGSELMQAQWISENIIEWWPCSYVNVTFIPSPKKKCYHQIPVNVTIEEEKEWGIGYLHPKSKIVYEESREGPCEIFQELSIKNGGNIHKIDQLTGQVTIVDNIDQITITQKPWGGKIPEFPLQIFRQLVIKNLSDPQLQILQTLKAMRATRVMRDTLSGKNIIHEGGIRTQWTLLGEINWEMIGIRLVCALTILRWIYQIWVWKQKKITEMVIRDRRKLEAGMELEKVERLLVPPPTSLLPNSQPCFLEGVSRTGAEGGPVMTRASGERGGRPRKRDGKGREMIDDEESKRADKEGKRADTESEEEEKRKTKKRSVHLKRPRK